MTQLNIWGQSRPASRRDQHVRRRTHAGAFQPRGDTLVVARAAASAWTNDSTDGMENENGHGRTHTTCRLPLASPSATTPTGNPCCLLDPDLPN
jgi:hypothetical protein